MPRSNKPLVLTERDLCILQDLADGKNLIEAARASGLTTEGVRYRIRVISKIIPNQNLTNLVVEAVRKGYID